MGIPLIEGTDYGIPRMLYASNGSNWYAILVDSDGHVKIDVITYPGSNVLGNFPFGYYDRYAETISAIISNAEATADGTPVPAGEIWVINSAIAYHDDPTARVALIRAVAGATIVNLAGNRALAQWAFLMWQGSLILKAGDKMRVVGEALASGKAIYGHFWGYKMKVS